MEQKPFEFIIEEKDDSITWHHSINILLKRYNTIQIKFTLKETIMGCGIAQLEGVSSLYMLKSDEIKELKTLLNEKITDLEQLLGNYKCMKVGLIICTLGHMYRTGSYSNNESILFELGFNQLSEYSNWRHRSNGSETQRLYGLKTNFRGEKNKG